MIAREGTWGTLIVGDYVREPAGNVWRVTRVTPMSTDTVQVNLVNAQRDETWLDADAGASVTILEPTEAEAIELVGRRLGGTVVPDA